MKLKVTNMAWRAGIAGLVLVLLTGLVSAAFTVQSFSCNSQSGTIVVESSGTLNCQATIKNTGSSSSNLSDVSLVLDGIWAESTSYTGLGFGSSVGAGATTTATFGNIKPITSGLHGFNYVRIGSVTDNYPSSMVVNVLTVKNMVLNVPDNATYGDEFTVSSSVTSGGTAAITLTLTVNDCALAAGETAAKALGTVSDNTVKSTSWRVVMGAGECSFNVSASSSSGAVTVSKTKSESVTYSGAATTTTTTIISVVNITLNEIMAYPNPGEQEWIEIYNAGNVAVNLSGWRLYNNTGFYNLLAENISVGGFKLYNYSQTSLGLIDLADTVTLRNSTGSIVDTHTWSSATTRGQSMMRSSDGGGGAWIQSNSTMPATPGTSNVNLMQLTLAAGWNLLSLPLS
ncbi:MAG: lamin tail domain-containing protein [Candidatus Altiarchaeota archaeon]